MNDPDPGRARSAIAARPVQYRRAARLRARAARRRSRDRRARAIRPGAPARQHACAAGVRRAARAATATATARDARAGETFRGAGLAHRRDRVDRAAGERARQDALHAHRRHGRPQEVDPAADHRAVPESGTVRQVPQEGRRRNPAVRAAGLRQDHAGARGGQRMQRGLPRDRHRRDPLDVAGRERAQSRAHVREGARAEALRDVLRRARRARVRALEGELRREPQDRQRIPLAARRFRQPERAGADPRGHQHAMGRRSRR